MEIQKVISQELKKKNCPKKWAVFPKWLRTISVKPSEENFSRKHSPKGIGQNWPQNIPECSGSAWNGSYYSVFPNWLRIISETQWKKSEEKSAICGRLKVNSFLKKIIKHKRSLRIKQK